MNKKEFKQLLQENNKELLGEVDVKFEKNNADLDKKLDKRFKDNNKYLIKSVENQSRMLIEHFEDQLSVIAEVQTEHTQQLKKLDGLTEMVAQNTVDLQIVKGMLGKKVDVEDFENHEKRIIVLERKVKVG